MSELELIDSPDLPEHVTFGSWVKTTREKKGLSLKKIASDAGISYAALYKIEKGEILNPRQPTVEKILLALGEKKTENLIEAPDVLETSKGISRLEDFDPYDVETIPDQSGVYVFYDISQRPVYVGRSKNLKKRIRSHYDRFWFKEPIVVTGSFIEIKDEKLRNQIEAILISFLKSNAVINKKLVDRDTED